MITPYKKRTALGVTAGRDDACTTSAFSWKRNDGSTLISVRRDIDIVTSCFFIFADMLRRGGFDNVTGISMTGIAHNLSENGGFDCDITNGANPEEHFFTLIIRPSQSPYEYRVRGTYYFRYISNVYQELGNRVFFLYGRNENYAFFRGCMTCVLTLPDTNWNFSEMEQDPTIYGIARVIVNSSVRVYGMLHGTVRERQLYVEDFFSVGHRFLLEHKRSDQQILLVTRLSTAPTATITVVFGYDRVNINNEIQNVIQSIIIRNRVNHEIFFNGMFLDRQYANGTLQYP